MSLATNRLTNNRLATNRLVNNRLATNRLATNRLNQRKVEIELLSVKGVGRRPLIAESRFVS